MQLYSPWGISQERPQPDHTILTFWPGNLHFALLEAHFCAKKQHGLGVGVLSRAMTGC